MYHAGNVANLPLVLVTTICTADTPYADALGSECERLGISYIAFGMWIASTFQYCVAYNMLKRPLHQKEEVCPQSALIETLCE